MVKLSVSQLCFSPARLAALGCHTRTDAQHKSSRLFPSLLAPVQDYTYRNLFSNFQGRCIAHILTTLFISVLSPLTLVYSSFCYLEITESLIEHLKYISRVFWWCQLTFWIPSLVIPYLHFPKDFCNHYLMLVFPYCYLSSLSASLLTAPCTWQSLAINQ